jgi:uncharacterized membrane protein YhaH (DUF805 family)
MLPIDCCLPRLHITRGNFMEYMIMPLLRYADFSGRSRRKEYWMFALAVALATISPALIMLGGVDFSTGLPSSGFGFGVAALLLFSLAIFIPALAVQVRRFHDQDKSGWFVLLNFVPYVGGIIVLVMMCLEGTRGPNRYGPDPKMSERGGAAAY